jgi:hypothetical protein
MEEKPPPKRRGRPPGSSTGPTGPRIGSRPWKLAQLGPGETLLLEAPKGRLQPFMQQVAADFIRSGMQGKLEQVFILGIEPSTRIVHEIVMVRNVETKQQ